MRAADWGWVKVNERADEVLIVGASTRAMAQSAARAGFRVSALDAYGDRDLLACAGTVAFRRDLGGSWSAVGAAREAGSLKASAVAYVSNLENYPAAVQRLARGRRLLGNPPRVLRNARNPFRVAAVLRRRGIPVPGLSAGPVVPDDHLWLLKPRRSGGGHGIRSWPRGKPVARSMYLQQRIDGVPGSITFVADGRRTVPLGLSRQLVGEATLGASGFRYCGNLLCGGPALFEHEPVLREAAAALAVALTESFGLVGVNGIDFIATADGTPWLLEINPRYSASMELVEREHGVSVFGLHASACHGSLPKQAPYCRRLTHVSGKGIVYARGTITVKPSSIWQSGTVADIPHEGERIAAGRPVCTVFARGRSARDCRRALAVAASSVYHATSRIRRGVA
jgi:uncharacterized protein